MRGPRGASVPRSFSACLSASDAERAPSRGGPDNENERHGNTAVTLGTPRGRPGGGGGTFPRALWPVSPTSPSWSSHDTPGGRRQRPHHVPVPTVRSCLRAEATLSPGLGGDRGGLSLQACATTERALSGLESRTCTLHKRSCSTPVSVRQCFPWDPHSGCVDPKASLSPGRSTARTWHHVLFTSCSFVRSHAKGRWA